MASARGIRLPLQIGTSSLWSLARASASFLPGFGLIPLAVLIGIQYTAFLGVAVGMAGVLLIVFAWAHLMYAWRDRPSDVILSADGIRVEGGRFHGLSIPWSSIHREGTCIDVDKERRLTVASIGVTAVATAIASLFGGDVSVSDAIKEDVEVHRLRVLRRKGTSVVVAEAERPIEQDSLRALLDSIRAEHWYGPSDPVPGGPPAPPGVVACPGCGAAVVPDEVATVACSYCGGVVAIPEAVQRGVRDGRVLSHSRRLSERILTRVIEQPGARSTGALFFATAIPMLLAWPIAFSLAGWTWELGSFTRRAGGQLTFFASAAILGLFFLLRARLVDRFALRLLTLGFAAHAPVAAGAPFTCRRCGAPLAEARDSIHVPCVYCATENLIGLDLGHRAAVEASQATSLSDALRSRTRERRLWSTLSVTAILLLAPATWVFYSSFRAGVTSSHSPRPRVEVLASVSMPVAFVVDPQAVYWTTQAPAGGPGALVRFVLGSSGPVPLAATSGQPAGVAVDAENVYWANTDEGTIRAIAKSGGKSVVVASRQNRPTNLVCYRGALFWTNDAPAVGSGDPLGSVMKLVLPDGQPTTIASRQPEPSSLAVDATGVYWTVRGTGQLNYGDGAVMRADADGSNPTALYQRHRDPSNVTLSEGAVFWMDTLENDKSAVLRGTRTGGSAVVVAQDTFRAPNLAAEGTSLYWVSMAGHLMYEDSLGGTPTALAGGQWGAVATALGGEHVYWLTGGGSGRDGVVARRLRPTTGRSG